MIFFQVLKKHLFKNGSILFFKQFLLSFATQSFPLGKGLSFWPRLPCAFSNYLDTARLIQILKTTQVGANVYYSLALEKRRAARRKTSHPIPPQASYEITQISSNHPLEMWGAVFCKVRGRKRTVGRKAAVPGLLLLFLNQQPNSSAGQLLVQPQVGWNRWDLLRYLPIPYA